MLDNNEDLLWLFSGFSCDYLLKVCCMETLSQLLFSSLIGKKSISKENIKETMDVYDSNGNIESKNEDVLKTDSDLFKTLESIAKREFFQLLTLENLTYREQLQGDIYDYLVYSQRNEINLWGYFDFRMQKYGDLIDRAVKNTLDEYSESREYEKCLQVIHDLMEKTEHRATVLHVVFLQTGGFLLLNENHELLEAADIVNEIKIAVDLGLKFDDVLAEAFIYYAPKEIFVHNYHYAYDRVSGMVWEINNAVVDFCNDCDICRKYNIPNFAKE